MDPAPWINAAGDIMARDPRQPLLNSFAGRWPTHRRNCDLSANQPRIPRVADLLTTRYSQTAEPNLRSQHSLT
jgi:hypothetical protein